jgi:heptosyltransferase-2/heptosyltransferase-3
MNPRPLVVRFGALGDMVILTVAIRHLHERFDCPVDIITSGDWSQPLLTGQPGVGDIYTISTRKRPYWLSLQQHRLVAALRKRTAGPTWLFDHDNRKICALLMRAGWTAAHWCHHEDMKGLTGSHFCERWLRFSYRNPPILGGQDLIAASRDAFGELIVTPAQRADVAGWLRTKGWPSNQLILIQVGNKRTMRRGRSERPSNSKYWPEDNWAAVLRGLREQHPDHVILLLGVPPESALNERILQLAIVERDYNIVHELSIPRLMGLARLATGMVSVDTGPAHVAAAIGCPVVTLFGSTEPFMYAPRGRNATVICLTGERDGVRSMRYIESSQVLDAWRQAITQHATH